MADENDVNIGINVNPSGAESGSRRAKVAIKGVTDDGLALGAAMRRLRQSIDPTFAAQEKYNRSLADAKALLDANLIKKKDYTAAVGAARVALDQETAALFRRSAAGKAEAQAQRKLKTEELALAKAVEKEKLAAAKLTRLAREGLEKQEQAAIRLTARLAAEAASRARANAAKASTSRITGVAAGSVSTNKSIPQLEAEIKRLSAAAESAAKRATDQATLATTSSSTAMVAIHRRASEASAQASEDFSRRAIQARRALTSVTKSSAAEELAAEKAAKTAARAATEQAARAARDKVAADRQAAKASREHAAAVDALARASKREASAVVELRSSIDPAFAAQTRYNETMRKATDLLMRNKLQQGEWIAIQKQAKTQMDVNVRSMGRMNSMNVQMGYQMQDVVASFASGINPLVILAQQSGQTAAALSQAGGKVGYFASMIAGPYGAAILGVITILGFLWQANSEAESSTKDLMNAQDRHKMSIKELTAALEEYIRAQQRANQTAMQGKVAEDYSAMDARRQVMDKMTAAQERLTEARRLYNATSSKDLGQAAILWANVKLAERAVNSLKDSYDKAVQASAEARAAFVQQTAGMEKLDIREQAEAEALYGAFIRDFTAAGKDAAAQMVATNRYQTALNETTARYKKLKEEEAAARRENTKAIREEERAMFTSRQDAIKTAGTELRKSGYGISENEAFGGVKANHPGMGNKAHGQYAIDINMPGVGNESSDAVARARMDKMVKEYQARGFRVLWNGKVYEPNGQGASYDIRPGANQHKDHAHMEAPKSIVGKPDGSKLAGELVQGMESAAQAATRQAVEAIDTLQKALDYDLESSASDKLAIVQGMEADRLRIIKEAYGESSKEYEDAKQHELEITRRYNQQILASDQQRLDFELSLAKVKEATRDNSEQGQLGKKATDVGFQTSNNFVGEKQGFIMKGQLLDEEYAQNRAHQERLWQLELGYSKLKLKLPNQSKEARDNINNQILVAEEQHQQDMLELERKHAQQVSALQREAAQATIDKWRGVAQTMTSSMGSAFQGMWMRQQSFAQGLINMADQLVFKFADMGLKILENEITRLIIGETAYRAYMAAKTGTTAVAQAAQTATVAAGTATQVGIVVGGEVAKTGATVVGAASRVAAETTAAVATNAITLGSVLKSIAQFAVKAAAGAYAAISSIPVVGPFLAPAAAAAALYGVYRLGSALVSEKGMGEVPSDGTHAILHKKETVLPAWIAEPMRQMFVNPRRSAGSGIAGATSAAGDIRNSNTNTSGDSNFYYQPKANVQDASLHDMLQREGRSMRKWFYNQVRNGSLKMP